MPDASIRVNKLTPHVGVHSRQRTSCPRAVPSTLSYWSSQ